MRKIQCIFKIFILLLPASIHAQLLDLESIIAPNAQLELLGSGYSFTEGPAVDTNGNVFFTDQPNNKIVQWNAKDGQLLDFFIDAGRSNGTHFDREGNLYTCADLNNELWKIDKDGNITVIVKDYEGKLLNGPNDLWIDPKGGIYFTDPLYKRDYWERKPEIQQDGEHVYYLSADGKSLVRVDEDLVKPNGITGTPDGKKLYVADIEANKTYIYNIENDGKLSGRKLFASLGSDGMTVDHKGNVYLTGNGVTVFNKKGKKIAHIPVNENWTANVCFGGINKDVLFITAMGSVYGLKMSVKGVQ